MDATPSVVDKLSKENGLALDNFSLLSTICEGSCGFGVTVWVNALLRSMGTSSSAVAVAEQGTAKRMCVNIENAL